MSELSWLLKSKFTQAPAQAPAPPPQKVCNSLSFQDIYTKMGGHLSLSHRLAETKCIFFLCVSVSWYICSLKNLKLDISLSFQDIFTKTGGHLLTDLINRSVNLFTIQADLILANISWAWLNSAVLVIDSDQTTSHPTAQKVFCSLYSS